VISELSQSRFHLEIKMKDFFKQLAEFPLTIGITLLTLIAFGLETVVPGSGGFLEYDTTVTWLRQVANSFTCHWLHWSGEHLFWDLGMFVLLCGLCEQINRRALTITLLVASVFIPLAVGICHPEVVSYRGLSGLDTALFGMAVVYFGLARMKESDHRGMLLCFGLLAAMVGKTIHELNFGTFFVESSNFIPVPVAHIVGAVIGISVGVWQHFHEIEIDRRPVGSTEPVV
jgi:hypothetical protein